MKEEVKTKRRYISKVIKSRVVMKEAVVELSANAFKLLNLIYFDCIKDEDLADDKARAILGVSRRPYFKAKEELAALGYIRIIQVGSTKYKWYVGKEAIAKDAKRYDEGRAKKANREFSEMVMDYYIPSNNIEEPIIQDGVGVYEIAI